MLANAGCAEILGEMLSGEEIEAVELATGRKPAQDESSKACGGKTLGRMRIRFVNVLEVYQQIMELK